jgi:hypothetical protein
LKPSVTVDAGASFNYNGCRKVLWSSFCDKGHATSTATISMTMTVNVGVDKKSYSLKIGSCTAKISNFNIHFKGGDLSDFLNSGFFNDQLKEALEGIICPRVGGFIKSKGGEVLNSFKTKAQIYKNIYLDYSLLSPVVTGSTYAASKLKGKFYGQVAQNMPVQTKVSKANLRLNGQKVVHKQSTPALCPRSIPLTPEPANNCPYYIRASDYVARTGLEAVYQAGILRHTFCLPEDISAEIKFITTLGRFACKPPADTKIANIHDKCKNVVYIKSTRSPTVTIANGKLTFEFGFSVDLLRSSNCSVCAVTGTATAVGHVAVRTVSSKHVIYGSVHTLNIRYSDLCPILKSPIIVAVLKKNSKVSSIQSLLDRLVEKLAKPKINLILGKGFPLPEVKYVTLHHPKIYLKEGYGTMCFRVKYNAA